MIGTVSDDLAGLAFNGDGSRLFGVVGDGLGPDLRQLSQIDASDSLLTFLATGSTQGEAIGFKCERPDKEWKLADCNG